MIKLKELLDKLTQLPRPKRDEVSHLLNEFKIDVLTLEEAIYQVNSIHKGRGFRVAKIIK